MIIYFNRKDQRRRIASLRQIKPNASIGAKVVKIMQLMEGLDFSKGKFYIDKTTKQKLFTADQIAQAQRSNHKLREIIYLKDIAVRKTMNYIAKLVERLSNNEKQIGFRSRKGIHNLREHIGCDTRTRVMLLDLENAFCQITAKEVFYFWHITLSIKREIAEKLTQSMTIDGHLYQGHPVSPILFNFLSNKMINELNEISSMLKAVSYADDITLVADGKFNHKITSRIYQCIIENGFCVNKEKTHFASLWKGFRTLGMYFKKSRIQPQNYYKRLRQTHLLTITERTNQAEGLANWLTTFWRQDELTNKARELLQGTGWENKLRFENKMKHSSSVEPPKLRFALDYSKYREAILNYKISDKKNFIFSSI